MTVEFDFPKDRMLVGNAITIHDDVVDANGDSQNMTGWTLSFVLRAQKAGGYEDLAINATTANGKITLSDPSIPPTGKLSRATIALTGTDTALLHAYKKYRYAVWRTNAGLEATVTEGDIIVGYPPPFPPP